MKKYIVFVRKFSMFSTNKEHSANYVYIVETDDILHILGEIYFTSLEQIYWMSFIDYYEGIEKKYDCINYKQKYPIGWSGFGKKEENKKEIK